MAGHLRQKSLHFLIAALALGVWALVALQLGGGSARGEKSADASFDRITVQAIDVVDPDGTVRLAIGNKANPPPARIRGKVYERSIDDMVGLVFYEENGDEAGGLVLARLRDMNQSALILDYTRQITDGVGLFRREGLDGEGWEAGLFVSDRRPYVPGDITSSQGVERIKLFNEDKNAQLVITDPSGNPRIRIGVDASGEPRIDKLDAQGDVID